MKFFLAVLVFVALVTISMAGPLNHGNQHAERQFAISPAPPAGGPRPPPPSTDGPYPPPPNNGEINFYTPEYRRLYHYKRYTDDHPPPTLNDERKYPTTYFSLRQPLTKIDILQNAKFNYSLELWF